MSACRQASTWCVRSKGVVYGCSPPAGWSTELTEADLKREGLLPLEASTLQAEFRGPLAFLEGLKVLGAPRYTMRTALDPSAKPHVIAVVERLIAASLLRFLLSEDALERADSA